MRPMSKKQLKRRSRTSRMRTRPRGERRRTGPDDTGTTMIATSGGDTAPGATRATETAATDTATARGRRTGGEMAIESATSGGTVLAVVSTDAETTALSPGRNASLGIGRCGQSQGRGRGQGSAAAIVTQGADHRTRPSDDRTEPANAEAVALMYLLLLPNMIPYLLSSRADLEPEQTCDPR